MQYVNLLDVVSIKNQSVKEFKGTKKYIATGDVDINTIKSFSEVSYKDKPSRANVVVSSGQVIFAKMKDTKKVVMINELNSDFIYSTGFCAVEPSGAILSEFLFMILSSELFQSQKDKLSYGATQKAISNEGLEKIRIPLPSLEDQKRISKNLDNLDKLIVARNEQLLKLDELVKAKFIEMFGDPQQNPYNWKKAKMGEYLTTLTDFSANGSYDYLDSNVVMYDEPNYALMIRTTDLEKMNFESNVKYIDKNAYMILEKSRVFGDEIIMNKIGSAGKIYLMPCLNRPVSLGRNAFLFRYNKSINTVFMYYLLTTDYGTKEIMQHVRGATTKTITKDSVRSINIIVPSLELQEQFASIVEQSVKSKLAIKHSLEDFETMKKTLMQKYFG